MGARVKGSGEGLGKWGRQRLAGDEPWRHAHCRRLHRITHTRARQHGTAPSPTLYTVPSFQLLSRPNNREPRPSSSCGTAAGRASAVLSAPATTPPFADCAPYRESNPIAANCPHAALTQHIVPPSWPPGTRTRQSPHTLPAAAGTAPAPPLTAPPVQLPPHPPELRHPRWLPPRRLRFAVAVVAVAAAAAVA